MRKASVTIGTLLVVGATAALVNCSGDDSSPTGGTGGTGGSGATGGSGGGKAGAGGSAAGTAGVGGSSGAGMPDSGATGGTAGAAGSGGKGGSSGAAGSGGKGGSSGAGGSAGSAGKDGGSAGSAGAATDSGSDAGQCPTAQPAPGDTCNVEDSCTYGAVTCTCLDPGPMGTWACFGGPVGDGGGGGDGGMCPPMQPDPGEACADGGFLGPCFYDGGHSECTCDPISGWGCIRH